ncbi:MULTISPECIES: hypothetical protein [Bradyrhizobium]|jgi:hypothetical protein|uniref:Uncharacterized protein n=1 Tax=Bradyrhizobium elkanii TaxID=29448 RepID=A0ABV4EQD1_BRAEL|nr:MULTISPECIES: hypothetical protein [Bradyrhizobium]MDI2058635.1 hypothetical protein [Bradyrhizobium sp. Mp19]NWL43840.1 hypothetical protein [Bradyrhizobium elkanii]NWL75180.1 hypothetical protein [Bradyrhizobium elkanii]WLA87466.1 hypothetical protein QNJ99_48155 [Bradyrhizobium elkanii]WLB05285.1 hypothetical protein QNJ80_45595 [Bradyrhizobium elkanii]
MDLYGRCTQTQKSTEIRHPEALETLILRAFLELERAKGIEPSYPAWEASFSVLNAHDADE